MKILFRLLSFVTFVAIAAFVLALGAYRAFSHEELVAVVRCEKQGGPGEFLLEITPMEDEIPGITQRYPMVGDQWSIGGDVLKWEPWLAFAGLKSRHKLTRLSSRYWTAQAEMSQPRKAYDLNGGTSPLWRWFYDSGTPLPFVDAVYGNAAYVPVRSGQRWGVYVTHSGYFIRSL